MRRKHSTYLQSTSSECSDATACIKQTTHSGQQALPTLFAATLPHNSSSVKAIFGAILQFIIKDLHPFSVVKNSGFQNLIHILEPRYTIPSRQHFSDKALLELYEQKKTELKSEFAEAVAVALTTDGSTSLATESYLTITCNYTVPFKSKLTVRCESRFLTRFTILNSYANRESRVENKLLRIESRIEFRRTENKSCNTTWHGYMYIRDSRKQQYARNETNSYYKMNVSSRKSVSSFISSSKVSNAYSICKQTVFVYKQQHV